MPELPEVETMRRGVLATVGGTITAVAAVQCACRPIQLTPAISALRRRVAGRRIEAVERRGKRVVIRLDSGDGLVFEPRMTGLLLIADPPDHAHLRFRLDLAGSPIQHVWYWDRRGLGSIRLLQDVELQRQLGGEALGPDALTLDVDQLRQRMGHCRRDIKVALLDQKLLAGIGNLYASEILHVARLHPQRRCDQLRPAEWERLQRALQEVLHEAIRHEGSTLSDGTYRNALNRAGGYQNHHRVYGRAGETCPSCGRGIVERFVQAQRATFLCPVCQGRRRSREAPRTTDVGR